MIFLRVFSLALGKVDFGLGKKDTVATGNSTLYQYQLYNEKEHCIHFSTRKHKAGTLTMHLLGNT